MDSQKGRAKWQISMGNRQPVVIQFTFVMSFLDNFSQRTKLDTKIQKANPTKMNFLRVTIKQEKKGYLDIHLFYR